MKKIALVLAAAVGCGALTAQIAHSQAQRARDLPVFGVETVVVAVPVFVLDKDGRAVPNLTADAFELEDDGKKVPIVAFQAVDAGAPSFAPGAPAVTRAAARRQFLFLFDMTFSTPAGVRRAREAALQALDHNLAPGDLAAAATFGTAGVRLLVGFTSDREQLRTAFHDLTGMQRERQPDPLSLAFDMGLKLGESGGLSLEAPAEGPTRQSDADEQLRAQLILQDQVERQIYANRVQSFLGGLEGLAQMLDSIQGRKQVLLLSGGFDPSVLGGVEGAQRVESARAVTEGRLWEVDPSAYFGDTRSNQAMDGVFNALAASDVVIHTLDVTGLTAGGDAQSGGGGGARNSESLAQLAINSGGRFIKSTNDATAALGEILDASRYYYVVAFEPRSGGKKPGQLRKLKIKVSSSGLKVSHRAGYTLPEKDGQDPGRMRLASADVIAKGLAGGAFDLRAVAVPYRNPRGQITLPVVLEIDGRTLLRKEAKGTLTLELYGYAFNAEGRIADAIAVSPAFDLAQAGPAIQQKGVQLLTSFRAATGVQDLRFLVRERESGRAAAIRVEVSVPSFAASELSLSPPLFMDDPRARVVLPAPSLSNPQLEIPFRLEDLPFVPEAAAVLQNGKPREVCVMSWKGADHATTSPYTVSASLEGGAQPIAVQSRVDRIVADADGFQRFVIPVTAKAPKGEYVLRLAFKDPASGTVTTTEAPVRIE